MNDFLGFLFLFNIVTVFPFNSPSQFQEESNWELFKDDLNLAMNVLFVSVPSSAVDGKNGTADSTVFR